MNKRHTSTEKVSTFSIQTLGCKANQYDTHAMRELLQAGGRFRQASGTEAARYTIINTCTVTARSDRQARQLIYRAQRENPAGLIVVTGCTAQTAAAEMARMPGVAVVLPNDDKFSLRQVLLELEGQTEAAGAVTDSFPEVTDFGGRTRATLKIQDGCNLACSYCIIPAARGPSRSDSLVRVLDKIERLRENGFAEIVLSGIHLGHYFASGLDLFALLQRIEREKIHPRIRLSSLDPHELSDELIDFLAASQSFCHHLHLSLQSGSDPVLQKMHRPYRRKLIEQKFFMLQQRMPELGLGADVIVGFPGETQTDFEQTFDLLQNAPLSYLHVFPFSPRRGTAAAEIADDQSATEKKARLSRLRALAEDKKGAFLQRHVGRELPCLFEGRDRRGRLKGFSRNYVAVSAEKGIQPPVSTELMLYGLQVEGQKLIVGADENSAWQGRKS